MSQSVSRLEAMTVSDDCHSGKSITQKRSQYKSRPWAQLPVTFLFIDYQLNYEEQEQANEVPSGTFV